MKFYERVIRDFGGYEKCKDILSQPNIDFIMNAQGLREHMLEYRRQHNIFEAGDRIVKASRLNDDKVYRVFEVADSLNWVKTLCGAFIDAPMFRHATDAEIQAGRRL